MPAEFTLLQVANVGSITGGTAACAWTVAKSLSGFRHAVAFLSRITDETRDAFGGCEIFQWDRVTNARVRETGADLVLLHNTSKDRCEDRLPVPTVQYLHSRIRPAPADHTVCCSRWLAEQYGNPHAVVLHQAVPSPRNAETKEPKSAPRSSSSPRRAPLGGPQVATNQRSARALRDRLTVGRLCTPTIRKWPAEIIPLYAALARRFPLIDWRFVGCSDVMHDQLQTACEGRAAFHAASWLARRWLCEWDVLLYHHPTLTESFGRTVAEAMRGGCIPVVDNRGGFREQITKTPKRSGFLCDSQDDFIDAIASLYDVEVRWSMSRSAIAHAESRFSEPRFEKQLKQALRTALQALRKAKSRLQRVCP